ncbi:hypothetical protein PPL_04958 [Heterostelium album PN500]|uniref:Uncharacterized protein n=1 Tax=Heterostelium pallidum (strain ATCC 26659 / Pp 5 / PN500) TaxID=670386 RepID=D3B914_HETP5|nr:hypothetical protein PPL_04958 [Heterostelium album PN500]EFA82053.1 hypothetical protein PPL_04958 [Heterostelium album PN500]|eukprot:XP_020434170.1 hypothetical protein PPL_04958 [Heterostelium album PN500]
MIKYLILFIYLNLFITSSKSTTVYNLFLNPNCTDFTIPCGNDINNGCPDITTALLSYGEIETKETSVVLNLGDFIFSGINNTNLLLFGRNITIKGSSTLNMATIDIDNNGNFFTLTDDNQNSSNQSTTLNLQYLYLIGGNASIGGVITINSSSSWSQIYLSMDSVNAMGNTANLGGVVGLVNSSSLQTVVNLTNSEFNINTADEGAVFYSKTVSRLVIINCKLYQNNGIKNGVITSLNGNVGMRNVNFDSNSARQYIIYMNNNNRTLNLNGMTFYNNQITSGSHIYLYGPTYLTNSQLTHNRGSTVIHYASRNQLVIINSTFDSNVNNIGDHGKGGALFMSKNTSLVVTSSNFTNNYASQSGGAIYFEKSKKATFDNVNFIGNTVPTTTDGQFNYGSAIHIRSIKLSLNITNSTFNSYALASKTFPIVCNYAKLVLNNITTNAGNQLVFCNAKSCDLSGDSSSINGLCPSTTTTSGHSTTGGGTPLHPHKFTGAQAAGIIIGAVAGFGIVLVIIYFIYKQYHKRRYQTLQ